MDVSQILFGGAVTLAGTVIVQLVVIPRVQARTRALERWENDVIALAALLDEEMPRALNGVESADFSRRHLMTLKGDPKYIQEKVTAHLQTAETELREANQVLGEQMARVAKLTAHVRRINPDAQPWMAIRLEQLRFHVSTFKIDDAHTGEEPLKLDDGTWHAAWTEIMQARQRLLDKVNAIADAVPMMPPPSRRQQRRARAWTVKAWARVKGWVRRVVYGPGS